MPFDHKIAPPHSSRLRIGGAGRRRVVATIGWRDWPPRLLIGQRSRQSSLEKKKKRKKSLKPTLRLPGGGGGAKGTGGGAKLQVCPNLPSNRGGRERRPEEVTVGGARATPGVPLLRGGGNGEGGGEGGREPGARRSPARAAPSPARLLSVAT